MLLESATPDLAASRFAVDLERLWASATGAATAAAITTVEISILLLTGTS